MGTHNLHQMHRVTVAIIDIDQREHRKREFFGHMPIRIRIILINSICFCLI